MKKIALYVVNNKIPTRGRSAHNEEWCNFVLHRPLLEHPPHKGVSLWFETRHLFVFSGPLPTETPNLTQKSRGVRDIAPPYFLIKITEPAARKLNEGTLWE